MKTSTTSSKSKFLFAVLLALPAIAQAKLVAKVHELKGDVFVVLAGKTQAVKVDMDLEEGSQLMVGDDSRLTIGDFFDRRYHLAAGSNVVLNDRALTLQKGSVWTQSLSSKESATVSTANLLVSGHAGEYITTYSVTDKRSQLTVISGEVDAASPREPAFRYAVAAGQFTMAIPTADDGFPRSPTAIGYDSLMAAVKLFPGVKSKDAGLAKAQSTSRAVASVSEKKGEIIFMKTVVEAERAPASVTGEAQKYFVKKTKRVKAKAQPAKVRVLGYQQVNQPTLRKPASTPVAQPQESALRSNSSEFLKSYELHTKEQPKHTQEVQRLIDDLKSH